MVLAVPPDRARRARARAATATASSSPTSARSPATAASSCATAATSCSSSTRAFLHDGRPQRDDGRRAADARPRRPPRRTVRRPGAPTLLALLAHPNIASKAATSSAATTTRSAAPRSCARSSASPTTARPTASCSPSPRDTHGIAIGIGVNPWYGLHDPERDGPRRRRRGDPQRRRRRRRPRPGRAARQLLVGRPAPARRRSASSSPRSRLLRRRRSPTAPRSSRQGLAEQRVHRRRRPAPRRAADARDHRRRPRARRRPVRHARSRRRPGNVLLLVGRTGAGVRRQPPRPRARRTPADAGAVPQPDADAPARYRGSTRRSATGLVASCHDVSEGGLAVALAEMCIGGRLGADRRRRSPTPTWRRRCSASRPAGSSSRSRPDDVDRFRRRPSATGHRRSATVDRRARCCASPGVDADRASTTLVAAFTRGRTREPARCARRRRAGHQPRPRRRARPRPRRRRAARSCSLAELVARPELLDDAQHRSWSPAGSATPTRSAPGACSPSTSAPTAGSATSCRAFVAAGSPVIGICNGFQVLTAHRPAARARSAHNASGRFDCRWVALDAEPPSRCIWTAGLDDDDRLPDRPRRGPLRAPRPRRARRRRPGRAALRRRQPQRLGRRHRRRLRPDRRRARPDAAPREPRRRPPAPPPPPRPTRGAARPAAVRSRACATPRSLMTSHDRRTVHSTSTSPCPTAATARSACRTRSADGTTRLFVTTDRLSAFDRIIAGVPYKGQVLNQLAAWWFERHRRHRRQPRASPCPTRTCSSPAAATPLPVEVVVRGYITGVTSTSLWQQYADGARTIYGYHFPDGLRKNTALPERDHHADHQGRRRVAPRRAADRAPRWSSAAWSTPTVGARCRRPRWRSSPAARRWPPTAGLILADTKYEFGARRRRRAAADRRGAHARLVAVLGRRHLRRAARRRRGAGEPRQGSRPPGAARRRLPRRRRRRPTCPPTSGRRRRRATSTPSNGSPAPRSCRAPTPSTPRIAASTRAMLLRRATSDRHAVPVDASDDDSLDDDTPQRGVRRARHLHAARRGRRPAGLLRPVRPAAPRPGGRRHRRQRRQRARVHKDAGLVSPTCSRPRRWRRSPATTPSATPATAPPASIARAQHPAVPRRDDARPARRRPQRQPRQRRRRCATSCSAAGFGLTATSDTEVLTLMLAAAGGRTWEERIERTLPAWKGAYSLVMLAADRVHRRPRPVGLPPAVGRPPAARRATPSPPRRARSTTLGCVDIDEVEPGEIVTLQGAELHRRQALAPGAHARPAARSSSSTSAAPTGVGRPQRAPRPPAPRRASSPRESPADADVVIPVPDSSIPAAIGYARAQRHPVQRRADQEPLHRPHVHRADAGDPRTRRGAEVQRARREPRRQAGGDDRRLARARHHRRPARQAAARGRRDRGAPAHHLPADHPPLPLRRRHGPRRRPDGRPPDASRRSASASAPTRSRSCRSTG